MDQGEETQDGSAYVFARTFWRVINNLRNQIAAISGGGITNASYQAWMQTLPNYDPNVDNQVVVRMHDGSFVCKIADVQ